MDWAVKDPRVALRLMTGGLMSTEGKKSVVVIKKECITMQVHHRPVMVVAVHRRWI